MLWCKWLVPSLYITPLSSVCFHLNRIPFLRSKKGISKSKYADVTIGLLVQKTECRITKPPERAMLSFENHVQFYNIICVLGQGQEKNQKQYLLFS